MVTRRVVEIVGVALEEEVKITLGDAEYLLILNQEVQATVCSVILSPFADCCRIFLHPMEMLLH